MTISFKKITKPTNLFYFQHIIAYPKLVVFLWSSQSCTASRPSVSMHVSPQNVRFVFNISLRNQSCRQSSSASELIFYFVTVKEAPSLSAVGLTPSCFLNNFKFSSFSLLYHHSPPPHLLSSQLQ